MSEVSIIILGAVEIQNELPGFVIKSMNRFPPTITVNKVRFTLLLIAFNPVSYTHLDVYKRQSGTASKAYTFSSTQKNILPSNA